MSLPVVEKKDEKRRALGRGLASLLPGPRVVPSGELKAPTRERNDVPQGLTPRSGAASGGEAVALPGAGLAVDPPLAQTAKDGPPPGSAESGGATEGTAAGDLAGEGTSGMPLSSGFGAGQPGAAVPALAVPALSIPAVSVPTVSVPASAGSEEGEVISIQAVAVSANVVEAIDLSLIDRNPYQTRYIFDADLLEELAESIKTNGVVQPIVVRPGPEAGRYVLVLGERRLRASKLAGRTTIPALVRRLSLQQAAEMTVLENVQRQDLNAIEQAEAFRVLSNEFNLTQVEIAKRIGVSRESVSNYMRLLRLPEEVMQLMLDGQLSFSDAREILSLDDDANIPILAKEAVEKKLKLDQIEERVREMNGFVAMQKAEGAETRAAARRSARWMDPNVRAAQRDMELTLGMRVRIKDRNGKGKITIEYGSVDDYQLLMEMLRGKGK